MKNFFSKIGLRKMDEMDKSIAMKSQRIALVYVVGVLVVWSLYESYKVYAYNTRINMAPSFLLVSTSLVLIFSQWVLQRQAVKDDSEYKQGNSVWKYALIFIVIASAIASIGAWFLVAGK